MTEFSHEAYPGGAGYAYKLYERRLLPIRGVSPFGLPDSSRVGETLDRLVIPKDNYSFSVSEGDCGSSPLLDALAIEFAGKSEIELLHAYSIAHLRRRRQPESAKQIFFSIWDDFRDHMIDVLWPRWLIAAMTTFGDHGVNPRQKIVGNSFNMFFGMLKLYEFERRISSPSTKYKRFPPEATMPLELAQFSVRRGDLDINLLARLHALCKLDKTTGAIGVALLLHLNEDPDTVFSRLAKLKDPDFIKIK